MSEQLIHVIKRQALASENEIYGWLIGYVKEDIPVILAIIECKKFVQQSLISAVPQAQEFQEISSIMPQGIGPIGIYHSHPFKSQIFHSHTDDSTLISLSNQFPNCVSLVTNGEEINFYQMGKKSETKEIDIEYIEPDIPKFLLFSLDEEIEIFISKETLKNKENIKIKLINLLRTYFEHNWDGISLFFKGKSISREIKVQDFLSSNLKGESIQLRLPSRDPISIALSENTGPQDDTLFLKLNLRVPIYISNPNKNFDELNETIKVEILSNNILQRVFNGITDYEKKIILLPEEWYLNFFGFFIKILCFEKNLNVGDISRKNFELVYKLISIFDSFQKIEVTDRTLSHITLFFEDIKELSKSFIWKKEMTTILKTFNKRLNL